MTFSRFAARIEGKRYDPSDRDDFHRDLRDDYESALRNGRKTPGLIYAHFGCPVCAAISLVPEVR